jgi:hypothetical protein
VHTIVAVIKEISNTYSEGVFVALGIQYAMHHMVMGPDWLYDIFPYYLINSTSFK